MNTTPNSSAVLNEPHSSSVGVLVSVFLLYGLIAGVGICGNVLVLKSILRQHKLRVSEYLILNLTATDMGACIVSIPLDLIERATKRFLFGEFLCNIIYPLQTILMSVSVMTLLGMSMERYRLIVTPFRQHFGPRTVLGVVVFVWVLSIAIVLPYMLVLRLRGDYCVEEWPADWYRKTFTLGVFVLLYFVPLVIMSVSYVKIISCLNEDSRSQINECMLDCADRSRAKREMAAARIRRNVHIVTVFMAAGIAFAACMLPTHICWLWHDFGSGSTNRYFTNIVTFTNVLMYSNSAIDPFIFGSIKLRRLCLDVICGRVCFVNVEEQPIVILRTRLFSIGQLVSIGQLRPYGGFSEEEEVITERVTCL
ncbi:predicted protein [Nematostella vectensis]|uniref:G-protein coupled receptors family 1 profile domain-containing protein n=1 Tax=Nematostella vectensis TaxID=45351 RepID=A7S3S6_NEMVE|nr:predicted protein [Nematostella vectensis]|eukprot:XP_001633719.1 predicted protein [Nematostella vectensis]